MESYILLDIGGTTIKSTLCSENGTIRIPYKENPSLSDKNKETILRNTKGILDTHKDGCVSTISMAFPGPFDYERGISYIKGQGKYDDLYGLCISDELKKLDPTLNSVRFIFLNDIDAFALGSVHKKEELKKGKAIAVTLGTGTGSAFIENGKIIKDRDNVPKNGWIYNRPFKDSILDDYLSSRGFSRIVRKYFNRDIDGKTLDLLAKENERKALDVYNEFSSIIIEALDTILDSFRPSLIIFGGNLSKGFSFFPPSFFSYFRERQIELEIEEDTSLNTFRGLYSYIKGEKKCLMI